MGHPPKTHRVEKGEESWASLHASIRSTVTEEVSAAVKGAMVAMEQSLMDHFIQSFDDTFRRQESQQDEAASRFKGTINWAREH